MANRVLDSWALIAFFEDEAAAEGVEEMLDQAGRDRHRLFLSVVNWAEVYYNTMREVSAEVAEAQAQTIASLPIDVIGIGDDLKLARQAAIYKATYRLSLADAFAAALAKEKKAELVTGDPEFKPLEKEIKIFWLKRPQ
jgi:predicted nucleic acid-binding protein